MATDDDLRFEQYLRDSFAGLVARLRGSFSERVAAEDVVQEALIRAWQLDVRGERIRFLEPWMKAAATNLARSRWRRIRAEDRALEQVARDRSSDPSDVFQVPSPSSLPGPLEFAIGRLSPRQGQIVALHYYGDLSVRAIAGSQVAFTSAREPSNARCTTPARSSAAWWNRTSNSNDRGGRP